MLEPDLKGSIVDVVSFPLLKNPMDASVKCPPDHISPKLPGFVFGQEVEQRRVEMERMKVGQKRQGKMPTTRLLPQSTANHQR